MDLSKNQLFQEKYHRKLLEILYRYNLHIPGMNLHLLLFMKSYIQVFYLLELMSHDFCLYNKCISKIFQCLSNSLQLYLFQPYMYDLKLCKLLQYNLHNQYFPAKNQHYNQVIFQCLYRLLLMMCNIKNQRILLYQNNDQFFKENFEEHT